MGGGGGFVAPLSVSSQALGPAVAQRRPSGSFAVCLAVSDSPQSTPSEPA